MGRPACACGKPSLFTSPDDHVTNACGECLTAIQQARVQRAWDDMERRESRRRKITPGVQP